MTFLRLVVGLLFVFLTTAARAAPVTALAFSPAGDQLLFARGRAITVAGMVTGDSERSLELPFAKISDLEFSPDDSRLLVSGGLPGGSGNVAVYDWPAARRMAVFGDFKDVATSAAVDQAGTRIAVASADSTVAVYEFSDGKVSEESVHRLVQHSRAVLDLVFDNEGRYLVTAGADRSLKVWNVDSGALVRSLGNHAESVNALAIRASARFGDQKLPFYCASASEDRTVRVWQPGIGRMVRIVRHHEREVTAVVWRPDGERLYSAGREGIVRVIAGDSDRIIGSWKAHEDWIYRLAIDRSGRFLATGDWTGSVKLWELKGDAAKLRWESKSPSHR